MANKSNGTIQQRGLLDRYFYSNKHRTDLKTAFMTIALMPFSYSIANGLAAGFIFYKGFFIIHKSIGKIMDNLLVYE